MLIARMFTGKLIFGMRILPPPRKININLLIKLYILERIGGPVTAHARWFAPTSPAKRLRDHLEEAVKIWRVRLWNSRPKRERNDPLSAFQ
jgi:hypothetical protein